MPTLKEMELQEAQNGFEELRQYTNDYHEGKITLSQYKSQSGRRGTFGQRDHQKSFARIRITGGRWDKKTLKLLISGSPVQCGSFASGHLPVFPDS